MPAKNIGKNDVYFYLVPRALKLSLSGQQSGLVVDYPDENPQSKDSRLEKCMSQVYVYSDEVLYLVPYVWINVYPRSYVWSISSLALELE